ncbi:head-tail joining protein [Sphingomonas sp. PAMC 26621]|uniref:head-tail joining protein n=1 Tax=Sphingomonas sp. PAMC 26621 TaxID=1112213 RepID=UPI0002886F02|nr:hypothetical protein [Sphingomonas sp. PAMC 26621]
MDGEAAALAAIRAAMSEPVDYLPAVGFESATIFGLPVIWSDEPGEAFQGPGNTTRTKTAEIEQIAVPTRPNKQTRITRRGKVWAVTEVVDRDDVGAWVVTLEIAA